MGQHTQRIDTFVDPATGREVSGARLYLEFEYRAPQGVSEQMDRWVGKMLAGAIVSLMLDHLQAQLFRLDGVGAYFGGRGGVGELIEASGVQEHGVDIYDLMVQVQLPPDAVAPAPDPAGPPGMGGGHDIEVHAHARIGGFDVRASSDGGLDTDGLLSQLKFRVLFWGIFAVVTLAIVGAVAFYVVPKFAKANRDLSSARGGADDDEEEDADDAEEADDEEESTAETIEWDGEKPFVCMNKHLRIEGTKAELPGATAVTATACTLELVDVDIDAKIALSLVGDSKVTLEGGSLRGSQLAVQAVGDGKVIVDGAELDGKKKLVGNAKVVER